MNNSEEEFNNYLQELGTSQQSWASKYWKWIILLLLPLLYVVSLIDSPCASPPTTTNKVEIQLAIRNVYLPITRQFTNCSIFHHHTRVIKQAQIKYISTDRYLLRILEDEYITLLPYLMQEKRLDVFPIIPTKRDEHEIIF